MPVILFVDDNKHVRQFCKRELGRAGYSVILCEDGYKALQVVRREIPDLVILDVHMPRMDGVEAAKHIRAQLPHLPIIFYTSHREYLDEGRAWPAERCISKSEDLAELKSAVAQVLARSQGGKSGEGPVKANSPTNPLCG